MTLRERVEQEVRDYLAKDRGCTCSGPDIGVGNIHEPGCGEPSPDDLADFALRVAALALEEGAGEVCRLCASGHSPVNGVHEDRRWVNTAPQFGDKYGGFETTRTTCHATILRAMSSTLKEPADDRR